MNAKQVKELRKAIRQQHPNVDESVFKKIYKQAKKQYKSLNSKEKSKDIIEIK